MDDVTLSIDERSMLEACYADEDVSEAVREATELVASRANDLGAPHPTGRWHDHSDGGAVRGPSTPLYKHDVRGCVGIVVTGNYAAMKDNAQHNTLLKAR